jgi:hypothetical protein
VLEYQAGGQSDNRDWMFADLDIGGVLVVVAEGRQGYGYMECFGKAQYGTVQYRLPLCYRLQPYIPVANGGWNRMLFY